MTEPSVYHSQGYNCAEALIKSYNEEHNTDSLFKRVNEEYKRELRL